MYTLILLSVTIAVGQAEYNGYANQGPVQQQFAPPAPIGHDGNVMDTPEVAQAKAAHFAEFARAAARAAEEKAQGGYAPESRSPYGYAPQPTQAAYARQAYPSSSIYQGANPLAAPAGSYPQQYESRSNYNSAPRNFVPSGTKAPFVPAPLAADGTVVDTPEVAALKATRLQELAEAEARAYKYNGPEEYSNEGQAYGGPNSGSGQLGYGPASSPFAASGPGQYGATGPAPRVYPGPTAYQGFGAASPYGKPYQPSAFQPQSFQSQQHAF